MLKQRSVPELEAEIEALKSALRWSLGFIVNVTVGLELMVGAKANTAQIRQGIKEALRRHNVPRGVLRDLGDAERLLKEWDHQTFRVEQDAEVIDRGADRIVLRHRDCPLLFRTMRRYAPFLIEQVNIEHYRSISAQDAVCDFLCVPHTLCRCVLVDWLSDGKFCVQELFCRLDRAGQGVCGYAIRSRVKFYDQ